ncbi:MAG: hypothetical protein K1X78_01310 [Verrucomicrobiaceae bacterium]|nr:hypothetical protein [Verrucomicrobiaceae bacterium]
MPEEPSIHPARAAAAGDPYFRNLQKGQRDPKLGVTVDEVLFRTDKFLVYLDEQQNIQWACDPCPENIGWMLVRVTELEARTHFFRQFQSDVREHLVSAKRMIAQGVIPVLEGGATAKQEAEAAFATAERFIVLRGREASLIWLYCAFATLAAVSVLALLYSLQCQNHAESFWAALACACAGGLGAFISRAVAAHDALPCDANAGKHLHWLEALMRWGVGLGAGGLMWLLVRGGVFLGFIEEKNHNFAAVLAFALLAGASERFLPTMLSRFDEEIGKKPNKNKGQPGAGDDSENGEDDDGESDDDDGGDAEDEGNGGADEDESTKKKPPAGDAPAGDAPAQPAADQPVVPAIR